MPTKTNIQTSETLKQIPETQKPQDGNDLSLVGGVGKKVNDIINQENMEKYIGEIRFNSEIDNIEELKSIIIEAIKPNIEFFGDKDIGKIDFNFISSRKEMNEFYGQETEDWLVGSGRDSKVTIFSQKVFDKESNHPKSDFFPILKHEIAHIFSNRIFGYGGVFLNEGISGYIANQSHKLRIVNDFEDIYSRNNWSKNSNYAQAYSFTRFLIDKYGKEKLFELLKNNPNTNNFEQFKEVFTKSYGINFEEVEKEWKELLNNH